jgi:hypothetical protein
MGTLLGSFSKSVQVGTKLAEKTRVGLWRQSVILKGVWVVTILKLYDMSCLLHLPSRDIFLDHTSSVYSSSNDSTSGRPSLRRVHGLGLDSCPTRRSSAIVVVTTPGYM